jgi:lipopolysaccharide transport system permease protein
MATISDTELIPDRVSAIEPDPPSNPHSSAAAQAITVITPPTGRALVDVGELWRFRDLLYFLTWRDVKVRYKQTVLGAAWAVLQPAMMMVVFTMFFARMAGASSGDVPYPLFVYAGLLPWTFFATAVAGAGNSVIGSERIITKIYFPRLAIPFATVAACVVDFLIACGLLGVLMLYYGLAPGSLVWLAPVIYAAIVLAALGVGTLLSALNVSYRDFRYVIPFLVQVWMFATPTVYVQIGSTDPARHPLIRLVLALNPMTGLIGAFRASVLGGPMPWLSLACSTAASAVVFVVGCRYFRQVESRFADII